VDFYFDEEKRGLDIYPESNLEAQVIKHFLDSHKSPDEAMLVSFYGPFAKEIWPENLTTFKSFPVSEE
jgi:hypothetical protein